MPPSCESVASQVLEGGKHLVASQRKRRALVAANRRDSELRDQIGVFAMCLFDASHRGSRPRSTTGDSTCCAPRARVSRAATVMARSTSRDPSCWPVPWGPESACPAAQRGRAMLPRETGREFRGACFRRPTSGRRSRKDRVVAGISHRGVRRPARQSRSAATLLLCQIR